MAVCLMLFNVDGNTFLEGLVGGTGNLSRKRPPCSGVILRPKTFKRQSSAGKVMLILLFDYQDPLPVDVKDPETTNISRSASFLSVLRVERNLLVGFRLPLGCLWVLRNGFGMDANDL
ncbi:hypothetical protein CEXT_185901 [Caerostris extrusa]|uniref:Uncharacterized protein n=1 Tax=Caerostris extrusa TaxID=172846 RepID=A0AAV4MI81_CAEEX|nr:hypothetical protein CEXT_185901 [Caerostris extrusa]